MFDCAMQLSLMWMVMFAWASLATFAAIWHRNRHYYFKGKLGEIHRFWPHTATMREAPRDE